MAQYTGPVQQRAVMSRSQLRAAIDEILAAGVDADDEGGPNISQLRKANRQLDQIMAAVERFVKNHA